MEKYGINKKTTCLIIEDEQPATEMLMDYISQRRELKLLGIAAQLSEVENIIKNVAPSIIFLDLIIPMGDNTKFNFEELPISSNIIITSALPITSYKGLLPKGRLFELNKPISQEKFNQCIDKILNTNLEKYKKTEI